MRNSKSSRIVPTGTTINTDNTHTTDTTGLLIPVELLQTRSNVARYFVSLHLSSFLYDFPSIEVPLRDNCYTKIRLTDREGPT
jgi:hypothetical protein